MAIVAFLVFASALAASIAVFCLTLAPAVPRIVAMLRDGVDPVANGSTFATFSDPRVRVRARLVTSVPQPAWRAAA